jgi:hypothetical protein
MNTENVKSAIAISSRINRQMDQIIISVADLLLYKEPRHFAEALENYILALEDMNYLLKELLTLSPQDEAPND